MNILEAFKLSNCGKVRRTDWNSDYTIFLGDTSVYVRDILADDWQPVNEGLTFERIRKECVAGETLLTDGNERLYLGFNRKGQLVTDSAGGDLCVWWTEATIKNWRIGRKWERGE